MPRAMYKVVAVDRPLTESFRAERAQNVAANTAWRMRGHALTSSMARLLMRTRRPYARAASQRYGDVACDLRASARCTVNRMRIKMLTCLRVSTRPLDITLWQCHAGAWTGSCDRFGTTFATKGKLAGACAATTFERPDARPVPQSPVSKRNPWILCAPARACSASQACAGSCAETSSSTPYAGDRNRQWYIDKLERLQRPDIKPGLATCMRCRANCDAPGLCTRQAVCAVRLRCPPRHSPRAARASKDALE